MFKFATQGSPYERGLKQGRACADLARGWMQRTLDELAHKRGCASVLELINQVDAQVSRLRLHTERAAPRAIEECCGIAAGMELDERTYFTATMVFQLSSAPPSCSTLGFRDTQGRPMFAKTDDIFEHELGNNVLQFTRPDDGIAHTALHFAGTIWTVAGINSAGLAMGMTGIPGPTIAGDGYSDLVGLHALLPDCATVNEALSHIEAQKINHYGYSLMLADASGNLALVEKNGAGMALLEAFPGDFLAHTNHILDPCLRALSPKQAEPFHTNGIRRLDRIMHIAPTLSRDAQGLADFLADKGPGGAIWQEGDDDIFTDFGVVFMPHARQAHLWTRNPAHAPADIISVPDSGNGHPVSEQQA